MIFKRGVLQLYSFLKALVNMIDDEELEELKRNLCIERDDFSINVKITSLRSDTSNNWIDVEVLFRKIDEESIKNALKLASKVAGSIDKKLCELFGIADEHRGIVGVLKRLYYSFSINLPFLPFISFSAGHSGERSDVERESRKEERCVLSIKAWMFVRVVLKLLRGKHH